MKKYVLMLLVVVMVAVMAINGAVFAEHKEGEKIVIGHCVMDMANEIFVQYTNGDKEFVKDMQGNVEVVIVDGASEPSKQTEAIENFITMGVDAIMLNALDLSAVEDVVLRAEEAGIKVGIYPEMEGVSVKFVFDEYNWGWDLGVDAGKWINERLDGKATIATFNQAELESALGRYNGYKDGVLSVCDPENIIFLEPISTVEPVRAMEAMENILQAHPEVKVILASADAAAVGAYQAILGAGLDTTDMYLGGLDGITDALDAIEEGSVFRCTVGNAKHTEEMGYDLIQELTKAVLGMDYQEIYFAPTIAITPENIAEYRNHELTYELDPQLKEYFGL